ncbi:MAG TPA: hypothetical protein PKA74_18230, partial [Bauldia sp.]|nr:hypothetical protein [Bauldia sp.]
DVGIGINPALAKRVKEADLLILVGGRMSEMPSSGYSLFGIPDAMWAYMLNFAAPMIGRRFPRLV